jgi:hypothetical protein
LYVDQHKSKLSLESVKVDRKKELKVLEEEEIKLLEEINKIHSKQVETKK